jgi:hypothetical protein
MIFFEEHDRREISYGVYYLYIHTKRQSLGKRVTSSLGGISEWIIANTFD